MVGEGNASEPNPVRSPAAIDSVNRFVYYVDDSNVLSRLSLDSNAGPQVSVDTAAASSTVLATVVIALCSFLTFF